MDKSIYEELLTMANESYRTTGNSDMSDEAYDAMKKDAEELNPSIDESLRGPSGDVEHSFIVGSQKKVEAENDSLNKWITKESISTILVMNKLDGLSMVVEYVAGVFKQATTRGDGYFGKDQTAKVQHIVPPTLNINTIPFTGFIRGEVEMSTENFEVFKTQHDVKNPRGAVIGCINRSDVNVKQLSFVDFIAFEIVGSSLSRRNQIDQLSKHFPNTPPYVIFDTAGDIKQKLIDHLMIERDASKYVIDGLVICDINWANENVYYPSRSRAFKLNNRTAITTILRLESDTGRTGQVIPTVILEPVELLDTMVRRASGYNWDIAIERGYGPGTVVEIVKHGDIIPGIVRVISAGTIPQAPTHCGVCNSSLVRYKDTVGIHCPNSMCAAVTTKRTETFISNMDITGAKYKSLSKWGINSFDDLLEFMPTHISKGNIFYDQFVEKVICGDATKILYSIPFTGVGTKTLKKILDAYSIDQMNEFAANNIVPPNTNNIGDVSMYTVINGWVDAMDFYNKILSDPRRGSINIQPVVVEETEIFNGMTFCFTGVLNTFTRKEAGVVVVNNGGIVSKSVTKNLTYLVTNTPNDMTGKTKKAIANGVKIITENEFLAMTS